MDRLRPSPPTNALHGAGQGRGAVAVHQREVGQGGEAGDSAAHCQQGGVQDVDALDLGDRGGTDADLDAIGGAQGDEGGQPLLGSELFRVIEQPGEPARHATREHHRGGEHRAGEGAAPDLVHASDPAARPLLQGEVRHRRADSRAGGSRASRAALSRWNDIDRAKGLAILLVVFGHLVARQGPHGVAWYEKARILVYLFHMPFFMYLSGYVAFRSGAARTPLVAWPALARRRAARLLLPFLLFGLAILGGKFVAALVVPVDNVPPAPWLGLRALLWNTDASPATSVWYLAVLFVFSVATPLLVRWRAALALGAALLFLLPLPPVLYADRMGAYLLFFVAGGLGRRCGVALAAAGRPGTLGVPAGAACVVGRRLCGVFRG